jgi:hypothetical protein
MVNLAAPNSWLEGVSLTGLPAKVGEERAMDDAAIVAMKLKCLLCF